MELDLTPEDFYLKEVCVLREKRENVYWKQDVRNRKHLQLEDHLKAANPDCQLAYGLGRKETCGLVRPNNPFDQQAAVYRGEPLTHPAYFTTKEGRDAHKKQSAEPVKILDNYRDLTVKIPRLKKRQEDEEKLPRKPGQETKDKEKESHGSRRSRRENKKEEKKERQTSPSSSRGRSPPRSPAASNSDNDSGDEDQVVAAKRARLKRLKEEIQEIDDLKKEKRRKRDDEDWSPRYDGRHHTMDYLGHGHRGRAVYRGYGSRGGGNRHVRFRALSLAPERHYEYQGGYRTSSPEYRSQYGSSRYGRDRDNETREQTPDGLRRRKQRLEEEKRAYEMDLQKVKKRHT
jgi:hypothetical protein